MLYSDVRVRICGDHDAELFRSKLCLAGRYTSPVGIN